MVHNVKAGIAAASSLAGTAMAYKNYGNTGLWKQWCKTSNQK